MFVFVVPMHVHIYVVLSAIYRGILPVYMSVMCAENNCVVWSMNSAKYESAPII